MKKFLLFLLFNCIGYIVFANAVVTQKGWRWRNDDGSETTATWAADKNQQMVLSSTDANIRLRMEFLIEDDPNPQEAGQNDKSVSYLIRYATHPEGPFKTISTNTAEHFVISSSGFVTNGTPTTRQLGLGEGIPGDGGLSGGEGMFEAFSSTGSDFTPGAIVDQNRTASIVFVTPDKESRVTEYEWVIKPTANISTNTYYFRLDGLNGYDSPLPSLSYTAASSNTAPTASNVTFEGILNIGETLTGKYDYTDANSDTQSGSTFKWYRSDDAAGTNKAAISGATSSTYTLVAADEGKYISFEVTPNDGTTAGTAVESARQGAVTNSSEACTISSTVPDVNEMANSYDALSQSFTPCKSGVLKKIRILNLPNPDLYPVNELTLTIRQGEGLSGAVLSSFQVSRSLFIEATSLNDWSEIDVSSLNVSVTSGSAYTFGFEGGGNNAVQFYYSDNETSIYSGGQLYYQGNAISDRDLIFEIEVGSGTLNTPPIASNVTFTGTLEIGETLTGDYDYSDTDSDTKSESSFKWYRSDDALGTNKVAISSATSSTYTLIAADEGKYISFEVTPNDGTTAGTAVESARQGAVTQPVLLSSSPTISFSNDSGFGDNIAQDGEGGSIAISDINIQLYPINSSGVKLTTDPLEYHKDWTGYPAIITYGNKNTHYGWIIKSDNGSEFSLKGIDFLNWGLWNGDTFVMEALLNGSSKGNISFTGNVDGSFVALTSPAILTSIFNHVDEVRIYQQEGNDSWIALNNVQVSTSVSNTAPVISSNGGGTTATANVAENTTAVTTLTATDAESDAIAYSISGGVDKAKFSINSISGVLSFVTAPDYETPADADIDNVYEVTVKVTESGTEALFDEQTISVTVTDVDEDITPPTATFTSTEPDPTNKAAIPVDIAFSEVVNGFTVEDLKVDNGTVTSLVTPGLGHKATMGTTGVAGSSNDQFNQPYGIAFDAAGKIYVADQGNNRIQIFNADYSYAATIGTGTEENGNDWFNTLFGVTVDGEGKIYGTDYGNHNIQVFNDDYTYAATIGTGTAGSANDQFKNPFGVAVDASGKIYVADYGNHRIQIFNADYSYAATIGTGARGSDNDHFYNPSAIAFDTSGKIYVADAGNHRIQIFNDDYTYAATIGTGTAGSANDQFRNPFRITFDASGKIYVADYGNDRIQIFNADYNYVATIGTSGVYGSGNDQFARPIGVAVDASGKIYVADRNNYRIQIFENGGAYQALITPTVDGLVTVDLPGGALMDGAGNENAAAEQFSITYDGSAPAVTIASSEGSATGKTAFPVTFTFTEKVDGFDKADVVVKNGGITDWQSSDQITFTATIAPAAYGSVTVDVAADVATDKAGNSNSAATLFSIDYVDSIQPTATITSTEPDPTNKVTIPVSIAFSEKTKGFAAEDLKIGNGSVASFTAPGPT